MTKKAEIGYGIVLKVGANVAATEATVVLGGVTEFALPEWTRDSVDATAGDSPGYTREYIAGMAENAEFSLTLNHLPQNAADLVLEAMKSEREGRLLQFDFTQNEVGGNIQSVSFRAFLTGKSPSLPLDDRMTCTVTLRPASIPEWDEVAV